jgi:hypothetical protein
MAFDWLRVRPNIMHYIHYTLTQPITERHPGALQQQVHPM